MALSSALDPFGRNNPATEQKKEPQYVVAKGDRGPYLTEAGTASDDLADAKVHPSQAIAGITADRLSSRQDYREPSWKVIPMPDPADPTQDPDDDPPYDQRKADLDYGRLGRRAA